MKGAFVPDFKVVDGTFRATTQKQSSESAPSEEFIANLPQVKLTPTWFDPNTRCRIGLRRYH
jgi:hypothetical protein